MLKYLHCKKRYLHLYTDVSMEKRPFTNDTIRVYLKNPNSPISKAFKLESHKIASPSLKFQFFSSTLMKRTLVSGGKGLLSKYLEQHQLRMELQRLQSFPKMMKIKQFLKRIHLLEKEEKSSMIQLRLSPQQLLSIRQRKL